MVAPTFEASLTATANGLESGHIVWDDEAGLSYVQVREWDELINARQIEFMKEYGGED